jgi:hypothetical protein
MTQHTAGPSLGRHPTPPDYTPRLRLKPKAPRSGYVDGAWWPYSNDLLKELPDLLAVLSVRLGPIERVLYPTSGVGGHANREIWGLTCVKVG